MDKQRLGKTESYVELRPVWSDDLEMQEKMQSVFASSSLDSESEAALRLNEADQLEFVDPTGQDEPKIISKPLLPEQRISTFDMVSSAASTLVAYLVSQEVQLGWYHHSLSVTKLDPWLLQQPNVDEMLQISILDVDFHGPEIAGLRFGSESFDGMLLLESEPSEIFLETMWSPARLRDRACAAYNPLRDDKEVPPTPRFRETVKLWIDSKGEEGVRLCPAG